MIEKLNKYSPFVVGAGSALAFANAKNRKDFVLGLMAGAALVLVALKK